MARHSLVYSSMTVCSRTAWPSQILIWTKSLAHTLFSLVATLSGRVGPTSRKRDPACAGPRAFTLLRLWDPLWIRSLAPFTLLIIAPQQLTQVRRRFVAGFDCIRPFGWLFKFHFGHLLANQTLAPTAGPACYPLPRSCNWFGDNSALLRFYDDFVLLSPVSPLEFPLFGFRSLT